MCAALEMEARGVAESRLQLLLCHRARGTDVEGRRRAGDLQLADLLPQLAAWFPGNAAHFQGPCEQLLLGISAEKGLVALPGFHTHVI